MYTRKSNVNLVLLTLVLFIGNSQLKAHEKNEHQEPPMSAGTPAKSMEQKGVAKEINDLYLASVRSIFAKKCFDCHSNKTTFPWYYKIPGVKQYIDHDISEAREHLDLSNDFPFGGHGSLAKDLEELEEVIEEKSMPPWEYRLLHANSKLSPEDEASVLNWINNSRTLLGNKTTD